MYKNSGILAPEMPARFHFALRLFNEKNRKKRRGKLRRHTEEQGQKGASKRWIARLPIINKLAIAASRNAGSAVRARVTVPIGMPTRRLMVIPRAPTLAKTCPP